MRQLLFTLAILITYSIQAETIIGKVDRVICGEMDTYIVGDACIVYATDIRTKNKIGLFYPDYDWTTEFRNGSEAKEQGKTFKAENCNYIKRNEVITVLKDIDSEYFYFRCNVSGFQYSQAI